jgi:hypothetical protein
MRLYLIPLAFLVFACEPSSDSQSTENTTEPNTIENLEVTETLTNQEAVVENQEETFTEELASEEVGNNEYDDMDWEEFETSMTKDFSFVILISTKSYESALERAKDASEKLGYPIDLRGLHPNEETGLSLPKEVCEGICGGGMVEYPQYLPRNDWGESKYVSDEYSNGFGGFNPGYFIVIVASGEKGDPIIQEALEESRKFYEDAYAKTCGVWMGCSC